MGKRWSAGVPWGRGLWEAKPYGEGAMEGGKGWEMGGGNGRGPGYYSKWGGIANVLGWSILQ